MRAVFTAMAGLVAALALVAPGVAQKPPKAGSLTLRASADQVTYSNPVTLTGKVKTAVAPLVGLRVGDRTPRRGQRVRFRGTVRPQHDGTRVAIQRKRRDGTWATVATPRLRDAGDAYSRYTKRLRIRRTGTYRTVIAAHGDHAEGISRERTLTV